LKKKIVVPAVINSDNTDGRISGDISNGEHLRKQTGSHFPDAFQ
jgi:hypothetical protein